MGSLWSTSFRHLGGDLCQPPTIINQIGIPVETHSNFAHKYLCLWPHFAAFSRPLFGRFIRSKGDAMGMCHRGAGSPGFIRGNAGCSREEQASRAGLGAAALRRQQPSRRQERCHERSGVCLTGCLERGETEILGPVEGRKLELDVLLSLGRSSKAVTGKDGRKFVASSARLYSFTSFAWHTNRSSHASRKKHCSAVFPQAGALL